MNYQEDSYTYAFSSSVEAVTPQGVILQETYFYPAGGGQPGDEGVLRSGGDEYVVRNTRRQDGRVVHLIKRHDLQPGDAVEAQINATKRYALMRMHTAAHVISAVLAREEEAQITGNQLGAEESRIDYNLEEYDAKRIQRYEELVNEELAKGYAVTTKTLARAQAQKELKQLSSLAIGLPKHIQDVRIVYIGDLDAQACAGTHVKNTQEVGRVTFTRTKNKGANNRRIYYSLSQTTK